MTQCVVVLGLLCVEMCLVWSWFGLFFNFFFLTCTSMLLLFVPLVCLSVNFELLLRLFILQRRVSPQILQMLKTQTLTSPSDPQSLSFPHSHTHRHTHTHLNIHNYAPKNSPHSPQLPLCFAVGVSLLLLTDFLVFLQSRKASEQAKSVDSKTDSIGSGRAIPIKQVSTFPHFYPTFHIVTWVSMMFISV